MSNMKKLILSVFIFTFGFATATHAQQVNTLLKESFAPGALYEFKIDTNGDAADLSYSVQFASLGDRKQTARVRRNQGKRAGGVGDDGEVLVEEAPVSVGREALMTKSGDYRFFFGWRSDPFFFDVNGNFNHMQFTGGRLLQGQECLQHRG